ncbi:hypothetical protein ABZV31_38200 [Streptomyces sp. NPDC005202]|uniref:hypothetical protein n=1 Tax=Streptomyces sp. NPDC005202 TaxID=3157021 RepID=UPI0033B8FD6A
MLRRGFDSEDAARAMVERLKVAPGPGERLIEDFTIAGVLGVALTVVIALAT